MYIYIYIYVYMINVSSLSLPSAHIISRIYIRSVLEEKFRHGGVARIRRHVEGGPAVLLEGAISYWKESSDTKN